MVYYGHIYAYPTVLLPGIDANLLSLNDGDPNDSTITIPRDFRGKDIRSAIDFYRALNHEGEDVHPTCLIILDTQNVSERGVLVLNLDHHNVVDALRMPAAEAGISVCSLSIDNTTWQETRESCNDQHAPSTAAKQFLLYGLTLDPDVFETSCQSMNDGLGARNVQSERFAEHRSMYVKGPLENDLGEMKARHCQVAKEMGCHESMFAVIDHGYPEEGVLLIKLDGDSHEDHIRKKLPVAGEILNWVILGLWTWHEASGPGI